MQDEGFNWRSVTLVLIAINVAVFLADPLIQQYHDVLAFTPAYAYDMPWTFVTSVFMHGGITHILFNMFGLFMFGAFLESRIGWQKFIMIYLVAGIVGNVGYMLTSENPLTPGVGASGAIYGVMGVLAVIAYRAQIYVMLLPIPVRMYIGVVIYALVEIFFFNRSNIASGAHLGGLVLGVLYGFYLRHLIKKIERRHRVSYVWE
ncbi:MAG: rhomboid family intramembrane serine protease [Candidatus Aenigmarchaeota archaeon]|nr:rhomboid family intramembrane serine protease [Candidatus Aenigmarchaeota archaeon]